MYSSQPSKITGMIANSATAGPWIFQSSRNSTACIAAVRSTPSSRAW